MKTIRSSVRSGFGYLILMIIVSACRNAGTPVHGTHIVEIKEMKFQPAELTVAKDDTIIFINRDMVAHNVTEALHNEWTSETLSEGKSWRLIATGNADYYCSIHQMMKGKILIK